MSFALLALAYLLGATPTSYWVGRVFHGIDLREHGSGNLGATNAFRVMGWVWAVPVMVVDVAKGFVPVWFFPAFVSGSVGWALAFGAAAIFGHMCSLWVGFRGGKGVATSAGVFTALAPWATLGAFLVWLGVTFSTGYVSLGSILAALFLPLLVAFTPHVGGNGVVVFTVALSALVVWAHRGNVRRLLKGEESRMGQRGTVAEAPDGAGVAATDADR
ncbi:MAG: glycerol-3-phosphate 1-O-acyltransferase PlsY [Longimicrobiales bacterium]